MKRIARFISRTLGPVLVLPGLLAAMDEDFKSQCERLKADTALVVPSQSIDDYPVWSPDSQSLAVNVEGQWKVVKLDTLRLIPGTWHGSAVAVAEKSELARASEEEVKQWQKQSTHVERVLRLPTGECVRLAQKELSTRLEITDVKGVSRVLWHTDLENCGGISLSPDKKYLAYICELNGIMVSDVQKLLARPGDAVEEHDECIDTPREVFVHQVILPDGYIGWIRIDYLVRNAPALDYSKAAIIRIGKNGKFSTSSRQVLGDPETVKFDFLYDTPKGLRPLPEGLVPEDIYDASITSAGSWYVLIAPKSYRDTHPLDDFIQGRKPLPKPGRLKVFSP